MIKTYRTKVFIGIGCNFFFSRFLLHSRELTIVFHTQNDLNWIPFIAVLGAVGKKLSCGLHQVLVDISVVPLKAGHV